MFEDQALVLDMLLRLGMASLLGAIIGLERDIHGRPAGLRTHLLVSLGSAVFMILSEQVAQRSTASFTDPGRIAAQIVTGIGFLGAGAIIKGGLNVRGLTTAACLWTVAAIGMAAGAGAFLLALATTLFALAALIFLKRMERFYPKDSYRFLTVVAPIDVTASRIIELVKTNKITILNCDVERNYEEGTTITRLSIRLFQKGITDKTAHQLIDTLEKSSLQLKAVSWEHS